jgi:hypothetical protein
MPWTRSRLAHKAQVAGVVRIAGCIGDPVLRLRFLQAAAPRTPFAQRLRQGTLRHWVLWTVLLSALLIAFLVELAARKTEPSHIAQVPLRRPSAAVSVEVHKDVPVWLVERTVDSEVYSNGLRIDTRYTVANRPRLYTAFQRDGLSSISRVRRTQPAGIVFHTTESCQAPFEAEDTPVLKRLGESVLEYVSRRRAYHYLIDRFGRVYRVVAESDTAFHAGYSVWADDRNFYINLNESFLGVSFEAQSHPSQAQDVVSPAQVRAAAMLTEMLRSRYQIPATNCVTHAQVSVNPSNMVAGYHTDWASGFPFAALGLPDNYGRPLPSLWAFGFDCLPAWLPASGNQMSAGVNLAEQDILRRATAAGMRPAAYRKTLREQYRAWLAEVRRASPPAPEVSSVPDPPADSRSPAVIAELFPPHPAIHKRMRPRARAGK